jgi:hypothetical protein
MKFVRVYSDGTVRYSEAGDFEEAPSLHPNKGRWARFVDEPTEFDPATQTRTRTLPATVADGDVTVAYQVTDKPLAEVKAARVAALAAYRYTKEIGGVTVAGIVVATDDRSKMLIAGAYAAAKNNVREEFKFKGGAGFVTLTKAQIDGVGDAVFGHVQDCYAAEAAHVAAINACETAAEAAAYDFTTGWP